MRNIIIAVFLINCTSKTNTYNNIALNSECVENLKFKKEYFNSVKVVDSLIYKDQNSQFKKSLLFISKYSYVSFESMANYGRLYPGGNYKEDRKGWIDWYEKNKCNNIQFKK
jgi:hypothetical protein